MAGQTAKFTVAANYYFGAPVARANVKYYVFRSRYYGWWREGGDSDEVDEFGADVTAEGDGDDYGGNGDEMVLGGDGKLDDKGRPAIDYKIPDADPKDTHDYRYRLQAEITDSSRRTLEASTSLVGVRSNVVAYASPERYVYSTGETARVNVTARDREGRPVQTRVKLTYFERRWQKVRSEEHTSELQSRQYLVCRLLLDK